jgi:hypothetical protein
MNWLTNIVDEIKWKAQDFIWAIQDKIEMWKINKSDEPFVGEIEVKPKKKKSKKKSKKK